MFLDANLALFPRENKLEDKNYRFFIIFIFSLNFEPISNLDLKIV